MLFEPRACNIKEQVIEDPVSGLTIQFEVGANGHTYMRIYGDCLRHGNREIEFGGSGLEAAAGTAMVGPHRPTWSVRLG